LPAEFLAQSDSVKKEVFYRVRYRGYLERDLRAIEKQTDFENIKIPAKFDFSKIRGLRLEAAQKLQKIQPVTLAQAQRISGVSPADISVLQVALRSQKK